MILRQMESKTDRSQVKLFQGGLNYEFLVATFSKRFLPPLLLSPLSPPTTTTYLLQPFALCVLPPLILHLLSPPVQCSHPNPRVLAALHGNSFFRRDPTARFPGLWQRGKHSGLSTSHKSREFLERLFANILLLLFVVVAKTTSIVKKRVPGSKKKMQKRKELQEFLLV